MDDGDKFGFALFFLSRSVSPLPTKRKEGWKKRPTFAHTNIEMKKALVQSSRLS